MEYMYCIKCGSEIVKGARFCFGCGSKLDEWMKLSSLEAENDLKETKNLEDVHEGEKSYWSSMYGKYQYIEYKGIIYCVVPTFDVLGYNNCNCTNEDCYGSGSDRKWSIIRFAKTSNNIEVIKEIKECLKSEYYGFGILAERNIPFIIYDGKIYYYRCDYEEEKAYANIVSLDVSTGEECVTHRILIGDEDSRFYGFLKGVFGEAYIYSEYDENGEELLFISNVDTTTEKKKILGKKMCVLIEAHNEQYLYYKLEKKLYVIDLVSFEVSDLSKELTMLEDSNFSVDPIENTVYVQNYNGNDWRFVSLNLHNEVVEELKLPQLPDDVECRNMTFSYDFGESGAFYNGKYWIVKINPEAVELGKLCGIMVFNKAGNKVGEWMYEKENNYIARNTIRFSLPSALSISYEIVDGNGTLVNFGQSTQGKKEWHERIIYLEDDDIIDSKLEFCSFYEY